jgi:hypothetical protein
LAPAFRLKVAQHRHDFHFHRIVESQAICRGVIEATSRAKGVLPVILETSILCDRFPERNQGIEYLLRFLGVP